MIHFFNQRLDTELQIWTTFFSFFLWIIWRLTGSTTRTATTVYLKQCVHMYYVDNPATCNKKTPAGRGQRMCSWVPFMLWNLILAVATTCAATGYKIKPIKASEGRRECWPVGCVLLTSGERDGWNLREGQSDDGRISESEKGREAQSYGKWV